MTEEKLEKIFEFLKIAEKLKSVLRYNKLTTGRKESAAEHCWRVALMVLLLHQELELKLDRESCLKMALVHDIAEAITGDIDAVLVAEGKASKQEKDKLEQEATEKIKSTLPQETGEMIYNMWQEYQKGESQGARFVKAVDKLETLTQLVESGYKIYDKPQFIANYADKAVDRFPALKPVLLEIKRRLKREFEKGNIEWQEKYNEL